jgi:hypothetical protein
VPDQPTAGSRARRENVLARRDLSERHQHSLDAGAEDRELVAEDRRLLIHPYLPTSTADRVVMVEGDGCWLTDARGRRYLDATGGLWLAQVGHGRRELAEVAAAQMNELKYFVRGAALGARLASGIKQSLALADREVGERHRARSGMAVIGVAHRKTDIPAEDLGDLRRHEHSTKLHVSGRDALGADDDVRRDRR